MERSKNRRKNYYIDKQFQAKFILKFCSLIVIGSAMSSLIIYAMSTATVTTTFENSRLTIKSTADFILPAIALSSGISVILISLTAIIITLFTSHKIAGPLYRLNKDVQELLRGNLKTEFNLRVTDEVKPLAESLNVMASTLRERISTIKDKLDSLELSAKSSGNMPAEIVKKIHQARKAVDQFHI